MDSMLYSETCQFAKGRFERDRSRRIFYQTENGKFLHTTLSLFSHLWQEGLLPLEIEFSRTNFTEEIKRPDENYSTCYTK